MDTEGRRVLEKNKSFKGGRGFQTTSALLALTVSVIIIFLKRN